MTYADARWFSGEAYKKLGFTYEGLLPQGYSYVDPEGMDVINRVQMQKHKLKDILPVFDETKSELENCLTNGFRRLWDRGQHKFTYRTQ